MHTHTPFFFLFFSPRWGRFQNISQRRLEKLWRNCIYHS